MSTTLSIDIGLHGLGCGFFEGLVLTAGFYLPRRTRTGYGAAHWREVVQPLQELGLEPDVLVLETMRIYNQKWWKGDPKDVLQLQGVAGCLTMAFPRSAVVDYEPFDWKGNVPTEVLSNRVAKLVERRGWMPNVVLPARCLKGEDRSGDLWHGVGVGLHHLGIMRQGRSAGGA